MLLKEAERWARMGNVNAVEAFLRSPESLDYGYVSIKCLAETLMDAYVHSYVAIDGDMHHSFNSIKRIAQMPHMWCERKREYND